MNTNVHNKLIQNLIDTSIGDFEIHTLTRSLMFKLHSSAFSQELFDECKSYCLLLEREGKLVLRENGCFSRSIN
ncbi:hypothetical protein DET47_104125 [Shewanella putrefaciens]|nr:hypothetical protein DET47_104125 [Shewanella putrefaciens]